MSRHDDPNTPLTVLVGLLGALATFFLIIGLQALYYHAEEREFRRKVVAAPPQELRSLKASQEEILNSYRWIDESGGVAAIPIDRAIELVARDAATSVALVQTRAGEF